MRVLSPAIIFLAIMLLGSMPVAGATAATVDGLIAHESPYDASRTVERVERIARANGLTVFKTVDHRDGAESADLSLRPTTVVILGNPKAGTPLMQCAQTIGIDLPMKMLVWTDDADQTWLGYNDPAYIAERHGASDCDAVEPVRQKLDDLGRAIVAPPSNTY